MKIEVKFIEENSIELEQAIKLYEQVFEDGPAFIEYFFKNELVTTQILGGFLDNNLVSIMFLRKKNLLLDSVNLKGCYIYGVATDPEHRGKGYMRELMNQAIEYSRAKMYDIIYLIPVDENIYKNFGFVTARKGMKKEIPSRSELLVAEVYNDNQNFNIQKVQIDEEAVFLEMERFILTLNNDSMLTLKRDSEYLKRRLSVALTEECGVFVIRQSNANNIVAIIITSKNSDSKICFSDIICESQKVECYGEIFLENYKNIEGYINVHPIMIYEWDKENILIDINDEV